MKSNYRNILLLVFVVSIIYVNILNNQFVWDDVHLIVKNPYIKSWRFLPNIFTSDLYHTYHGKESIAYYRPLQSLSLMLDYRLWHLNLTGYHITNILLHIFNVILVYFLTNTIVRDKRISLLTGLFFAVHPVHVAAVSYISGRADLLVTFFLLLSFILFIRDNRGSIAFFILALFCKETALILPFILISYGLIFPNQNSEIKAKNKRGRPYRPFFIIGIIYCIIRSLFFEFAPKIKTYTAPPFLPRILSFPGVAVQYVKLLFVPSNLHMEREIELITSPLEPAFIFSIVLLCIAIGFVIISYRLSKPIFFGLIWFFLNLVPVSNIVLPLRTLIAEHWLYLPSVGFFIALSAAVFKIDIKTKTFSVISLKRIGAMLIALILVSLSVITIKQNTYWKNELTLYRRVLKFNPRNYKARTNLGILYMKEGRNKEAMDEFTKAIELNPRNFVAYNAVGNLYFREKSYDKAMVAYKKSLELNPMYSAGYVNIGAVFYEKGLYDEAVKEFKKALEINPYDIAARENLIVIYLKKGLNEKASLEFQKSLSLNPKIK